MKLLLNGLFEKNFWFNVVRMSCSHQTFSIQNSLLVLKHEILKCKKFERSDIRVSTRFITENNSNASDNTGLLPAIH